MEPDLNSWYFLPSSEHRKVEAVARIYDEKGNRIRARQRTATFIDLTHAPRFDTQIPANLMYSMVVVPSKDGQPMIALVNPTLLATTEDVIARISTARQQFVDEGVARDAQQQAMIDQMAALLVALQARKVPVPLDDVVIPASALITLSVTELVLTRSCLGIKTTDAVAVTPKSLSAGYGLRGFSVPANDQITLRVQAPILSVGGTAQTFGVVAFR